MYTPDPHQEDAYPVQFLPISGPSMLPTLRPMDLLELRPYGETPVRVGDVVAFLPPGRTIHVIHRVVDIQPEGIRTRGDNNLHEDPADLALEELVGRVIAAWRGQKRRTVHGGSRGRVIAAVVKVSRRIDRALSWSLRTMYHTLSRGGALRALLPRSLRPRVVRFGSPEHPSMMLLFLGRSIGRYDSDRQRWVIRRPFKLFVDEARLSGLSMAHPNKLTVKR